MSVRAKFVCVNASEATGVQMLAVTGGSKENEEFWKYTPAGQINLHIDNPDALKQFEVGKEYYADFKPAN